MKKYILFTNTKEKYHAHSLEFENFCDLEKHLKKEFNFEEWNFEDILKEYFNFLEDRICDTNWLFEMTIKEFLDKIFNVGNGIKLDELMKICEGECLLLSTYADATYSCIIDSKDLYNKTDCLIMALNELLSKHGTTTSPVGVVNVYEIVAVGENIEGQEELELPF